jgi:hypothetical protein
MIRGILFDINGTLSEIWTDESLEARIFATRGGVSAVLRVEIFAIATPRAVFARPPFVATRRLESRASTRRATASEGAATK